MKGSGGHFNNYFPLILNSQEGFRGVCGGSENGSYYSIGAEKLGAGLPRTV